MLIIINLVLLLNHTSKSHLLYVLPTIVIDIKFFSNIIIVSLQKLLISSFFENLTFYFIQAGAQGMKSATSVSSKFRKLTNNFRT